MPNYIAVRSIFVIPLLVLGGCKDSEPASPESSDTSGTGSTASTETGETGETELRELVYDDNRGDTFVPGDAAGNAVAVRFSAPAGAVLNEARFLLQDGGADTPFGVSVLGVQPDGSPGDALYPTDGSPLMVSPTLDPEQVGWVDVDLSAIELDVSGDFFVAMEWLTAPGPGLYDAQRLAIDLSEPDDRTWLRAAGVWDPVAEWAGFPNVDAVIRTRIEVPVGSLPPDPVVLTNVSPACREYEALGPTEGHEGALAVTRIEADAPFHLDHIRLQMAHTVPFGGTCDATIPFEVELFRGMGALHDANPEVVETFSIAASDIIDFPVFQIDLEPATTVDLEAGEALFIAIHMETELDGRTVCVDTCNDPVVVGLAGWSQATEPPYTWVPLTDFGVSVNLDVLLFGSPG